MFDLVYIDLVYIDLVYIGLVYKLLMKVVVDYCDDMVEKWIVVLGLF